MDALSRRENELLTKELRAKAYKLCDPVVKEYVECTKQGTFTGLYRCQGLLEEMRECIHKHMSVDKMEEAKAQVLRERRALKRKLELEALADGAAQPGTAAAANVKRAAPDQPTVGLRMPPEVDERGR